MTDKPATFRKSRIRWAVKAAEAAGLNVTGITVGPDGSITVTGEKTGEGAGRRLTTTQKPRDAREKLRAG